MNIVVALNNVNIKEEIDRIYGTYVYDHDIDYMEGVVEYLSSTREERNGKSILITKDSLSGNLIKQMYIKQLKFADSNIKIVLIVENLTNEYKEFLFANEVFNIIEGDSINIDEIKESIEKDKNVIYKYSNNSENGGEIKAVTNNQILTKKFIAIYGTSGSGKSYVSNLISRDMAQKLNIKTSLLDMDIQNPSLDIYNDLCGAGNILSKIVDDIDKSSTLDDIISKYLYKDNDNKNLWLMSNNASIYECQNKFSPIYYKKIFDACKKKFDYVIVDLPASPFIDVVSYTLSEADQIIFVLNPNYISVRQAVKYLELITKLWLVPKEKIHIVINKYQNNSLDVLQIESFLEEYSVIANIKYDIMLEGYINALNKMCYKEINIDKFYELLGIRIDKEKKIDKKLIFSQIINRRKIKEVVHDN